MTSEELAFVKSFDPERASAEDGKYFFELRAKMGRREIYAALECDYMKSSYLLGALLYDDITEQGTKPLTATAVKQLDETERKAVVVYLLEHLTTKQRTTDEEVKIVVKAIERDTGVCLK